MKVFIQLNCLDHGMVQSKALLMFSHPDYVRSGKHTAMLTPKSLYGSTIHSCMCPAIQLHSFLQNICRLHYLLLACI